MARGKIAAREALGKKKASKEVKGSLLDMVILLPVLAFIFFSVTHPVWYFTYITSPLFGPLFKCLGAWLKA